MSAPALTVAPMHEAPGGLPSAAEIVELFHRSPGTSFFATEIAVSLITRKRPPALCPQQPVFTRWGRLQIETALHGATLAVRNLSAQTVDHRFACRTAWLVMDRLAADAHEVHLAIAHDVEGVTDAPALATELAERLREAWDALGFGEGPPAPPVYPGGPAAPVWAPSAEDGMLWLDARAACFLEGIGEHGRQCAADLRQQARARWTEYQTQRDLPGISAGPMRLWRLWVNVERNHAPANFPVVLAAVLWADVVGRRVRLLQEKPAAMRLPVAESMERLWRPDRRLLLDRARRVAELRTCEDELMAATAELDAREFERLARDLRHVDALAMHKLVRDVVVRAQTRHADGVGDPGRLQFPDVDTYADELGVNRDDLLSCIRAGQALRHRWRSSEIGGLWTYIVQRSSPRTPGSLTISLSDALLPPSDNKGQRQGWFVPVPPLPSLAAFRRNEWGRLLAFQFAIMLELFRHRRSLAAGRGAPLSGAKLADMARRCGLSPTVWPRAIEQWTEDQGDAPAFLEVVAPGRYHLGDNPAFGAARARLEAAGRLTADRSAKGKRSAAARAKSVPGKKKRTGPKKSTA